MTGADGETQSGTVDAARRTYSVVSCHFGDPFWIEQLTHSLGSLTAPGVIGSFRVVNQDATPGQNEHLWSLPLVTDVLSLPRCEAQTRGCAKWESTPADWWPCRPSMPA